jgi:hypothetical protein
MKVVKAKLKNVLGVREFELDADGKINVISGPNGSGKSSVLAGLKNLIGGGNLATLRNIDAPEGEPAEGVLELDGDGDGKIIITKKDGKLDVRRQVGDSAAFEKVPSPQRFLDALFDAPAANPVTFLSAKDDKERIQRLLEALPLELDMEELWSSIGLNPKADQIPAFPMHEHPLQVIAEVRKAIFDTRTGTNTTARDKAATAEQIRRDIPAEQPSDVDAEEKQRELDALRREASTKRSDADHRFRETKAKEEHSLAAISKDLNAELTAYESELAAEFSKTNAEVDAEIAEIRAAAERKIELAKLKIIEAKALWQSRFSSRQENSQLDKFAAQTETERAIAEAEAAREKALEEAREIEDRAAKLAAELATIRERQRNATAILALRNQADKQEAEADAARALSQRYTEALNKLDKFKAEMTKNLPISGLDLTGGEIRVNGILWKQLNTAQQIRIAVQVSCLRFGDKTFRPIFVDGAEALDEKSFGILEEELSAAGAQAFIARVSSDLFSAAGMR